MPPKNISVQKANLNMFIFESSLSQVQLQNPRTSPQPQKVPMEVHVSKVERTKYQNIPQTYILPQTTKPWMEKKKKKIESARKKDKEKNFLE